MRKKVQAGINVVGCLTAMGERRLSGGKIEKVSCGGTGFVPVNLLLLAKIRTFGGRKFNTRFSCGHYHEIMLEP